MKEINIKEKEKSASHWASGSWGQGQFDKARYDDITMFELWSEIASIATKNAQKHIDSHYAKAKSALEKESNVA